MNCTYATARTSASDLPFTIAVIIDADAWLIATRLPVWLASPNSEIGGATGNLHLEPDGRIERTLSWSVFRAGVSQAANGP